jgi:type I restriction enzyme, R subunit
VMSVASGVPLYGGAGDFRSYRLKVESYLRDHQDDASIYKLRHNLELTAKDIRHMENVLWSELGTEDDYKRTFPDEPLVRLVARLVGLDTAAAHELFSEFLSDNSLNSNQMDFVRMVVAHVTENGFLDKQALSDPPFDNYGDLASLFEGKIETIQRIVKRIDGLNSRLVVA